MWTQVLAYIGLVLFAGATIAGLGLWCWLSARDAVAMLPRLRGPWPRPGSW